MQMFKSVVAFATMSLVVYLGACSAGSRFAPAPGGMAQIVSRNSPSGPPALAFLNAVANPYGHSAMTTLRFSSLRFHRVGTQSDRHSKTIPYLFASDNTTGNVNEFDEDNPDGPIGVCNACGGFGLAISPTLPIASQLMAVGTSGGTVNVYSALSTGTPKKFNSKALKLSGGGSGYNAYGLCWDNRGGLWADNYPSNTIDYFDSAIVAAGGGPTRSIADSTNVDEFYLACDWRIPKTGEFILLGYGYDSSGNVNITNINSRSGSSTIVQTLGNTTAQTGYPGGITLDKHDNLVANNSYGTVYYFKEANKWSGKAAGDCTWGFNPNAWTSIVFDDTQKETWAGDTRFDGLGDIAVSAAFPYSASGGACKPGESGGPSNPISGEDAGYLGVAVWPNAGV